MSLLLGLKGVGKKTSSANINSIVILGIQFSNSWQSWGKSVCKRWLNWRHRWAELISYRTRLLAFTVNTSRCLLWWGLQVLQSLARWRWRWSITIHLLILNDDVYNRLPAHTCVIIVCAVNNLMCSDGDGLGVCYGSVMGDYWWRWWR
jgi:hypothetical protein